MIRCPLHVDNAARDHASGQGIDEDGKYARLSYLGLSESVLIERVAAVHSQAEHRVKALGEQVMVRVLGDRVWVGDSAHGNGGVRTDANDDAEVLADGFRAV